MKPLDDETKRMLAETHAADAPSAGSEGRIWQALSQSWDKPLPPMAAAASKAAGVGVFGSSGSVVGLPLLIGAIVASVGVTAAVSWQVGRATPVVPHNTAAPAQPTTLGSPQMPRAVVPLDPGPEPQTVASPAAVQSQLTAETRLIASAQRALSAGAPHKALALLERHRARFSHGDLTQEREAARVFALCALGRTDQANLVRLRFLELWPGSPLASRVRDSCVMQAAP